MEGFLIGCIDELLQGSASEGAEIVAVAAAVVGFDVVCVEVDVVGDEIAKSEAEMRQSVEKTRLVRGGEGRVDGGQSLIKVYLVG